MEKFFNNLVGNELFFVYGLIAIVVALIIAIVFLDRRESKKKPKNLFDTLNMDIISETEVRKEKEHDNKIEESQEIKNVSEVEMISNLEEKSSQSDRQEERKIELEEELETNLEKTQAQIRVEEIKKALEKAQQEEELAEDQFEKFEKEQEQSAIISYHELKKSFNQLYSENEKNQYLEDDQIPINLQELYHLKTQQEKVELLETEIPKQEEKKVQLKDLSDLKSKKDSHSTFKSSPYISPVYGIQQPELETDKDDHEIQNTNDFLQNLKELKSNLD